MDGCEIRHQLVDGKHPITIHNPNYSQRVIGIGTVTIHSSEGCLEANPYEPQAGRYVARSRQGFSVGLW